MALVAAYLAVTIAVCAAFGYGGQALESQASAAPKGKGPDKGKQKEKDDAAGGGLDQIGAGGAAGQRPASHGTSNAFDFIKDPQCRGGTTLKGDARRNCQATNTVTGAVPLSNQGLDVNIATDRDILFGSVPDPIRGFQSVMSSFANMLWIGFAAVLKGILSMVSWAFGLNPFDSKTLPELERTLGQFYGLFTNPLIVTAIVVLGGWLLWKGLVQRRGAESVGEALLVLVVMLLGLWVIHSPRETVGRIADTGNDLAMLAIAAPLDGSVSNPPASYSEAMADFWDDFSRPAFSRLNFDDPEWATTQRPPKGAIDAAYAEACTDQSIIGSYEFARRFNPVVESSGGIPVLGDEVKRQCAAAARRQLPKPRTVADLYMSFSPGSDARNALWDYFKEHEAYADKVAIQGPSGWLIRLPLALLVLIGLLGALLMLGWIGIRLFMQAAIALVLTAALPLAIFMPIFGEAGRNSFKAYATTLLGALLAKVIYAAILAVTLIAGKLIGLLGDTPVIALFLSAAFWWAIFLKRAELVSFVSPQRDGGETASAIRGFSGMYAATQLGRMVTGAARAPGAGMRHGLDRHDTRSLDKDAAAATMANEDLDRAAERYGDARYGEAKRLLGGEATNGTPPSEGEVRAARDLVTRADANEAATGSRFNSADIRQLREEMGMARSSFSESQDYEKHAWRVGKSPGEPLSAENRRTIAAEIAGESRAEEIAGGEPRRRVRQRWAQERHGVGHPLNSERRKARRGALHSRRHDQRRARVIRGRDRRSILRGF